MRKAFLQIASFAILGVTLAQAQPASSPTSGPPKPPHWYQTVTNGVTLHYLTPVAYFRGLLGMTPAERQRVLAEKSRQEQESVLAKVREYEAMPRDMREERLRQTELHWQLLVLLRLDPSQRQERMKQISPLYQPMILGQLAQWDSLPLDMRQALLEKETFLRTYVEWQGHAAPGEEDVLRKLPAEQRARWTQELNRWQALPEARREELCGAFRQFFYLTADQRKQTVQALSEAERRQMEQALQSFANLPPAQQRECVDSFSKFAAMSGQERNQFLQNAAKWEAMSVHERQLWRTLVDRLPPMPPGFYNSSMPPMPPGWRGAPLSPNSQASK